MDPKKWHVTEWIAIGVVVFVIIGAMYGWNQ